LSNVINENEGHLVTLSKPQRQSISDLDFIWSLLVITKLVENQAHVLFQCKDSHQFVSRRWWEPLKHTSYISNMGFSWGLTHPLDILFAGKTHQRAPVESPSHYGLLGSQETRIHLWRPESMDVKTQMQC